VFYTKLLKLHNLRHDTLKLVLTFGGMCCWRRFGVARVFALVMRCRDMIVTCLFSRWQKP